MAYETKKDVEKYCQATGLGFGDALILLHSLGEISYEKAVELEKEKKDDK